MVLLGNSRYCDNSKHESETVPVSPLPRVSEPHLQSKCSRKTCLLCCIMCCKMQKNPFHNRMVAFNMHT